MARILLADDSTHAQRMGAKILTAEGHQVTTVSNGQAAISSLEKTSPELIIADVFMPGRNGYEVCKHIKTDEKFKGIPVLLIIGAMEPYDPEEGRRSGADGLITKPLESSNLVATVKDLLAASKRFAPARATVPKETLSGKIVLETASGEVEMQEEEAPQWEEPAEEIISTPVPEKLEIPHELSQQPIGMLTELLEPTAETPPADAGPASVREAQITPEFAEPQESGADALASLDAGPALAAPPQWDGGPQTVWTAEPATVTVEEEKLFDQPMPDWGDLAQLVEQSGTESPAATPLPWQMASEPALASDPGLEVAEPLEAPIAPDSLLYMPENVDAPTATEPEIEHYSDLSEATVAQSVRAVAVEQRAGEVPAETPLEMLPADMLDHEPPAAMASANGGDEMENDPGADRQPESEGETSSSSPAASADAPTPPGPVEELEAAPAERNYPPGTVQEIGEKPSETASVDPATLEHIIRGVVGELMPQIVAQVKKGPQTLTSAARSTI